MNSDAKHRHRSPLSISAGRFLRNRVAVVCMGLVVFFVAACVVGPLLLPDEPERLPLERQNRPPTLRHWFGTDSAGRDLLLRCLEGGRISLAVGLVGTAVSVIIGVGYGAVAGYIGGRADNVMMRFVDILYGLPYMLFVVLIMALIGEGITPAQRILAMFIALGAVQWLTMARIVRGEVTALREEEFVEAARAAGARGPRIIFRHIVPNLAGVGVVYATLTVPAVMLQEAFLSFLGLGVQAPLASWGLLIKHGAGVIEYYPWLVIFPGAMFTAVLFALNFVGDGLRDAFDPQMHR
jgi:oligopeptide transport system permease protein